MKGYAANIEKETIQNAFYRQVIYTSHYTQLVLMSLKPGEEIGNEIHGLDQFIRIEQGQAQVILENGETKYDVEAEWAVVIPSGTWHNVVNTGKTDLKLYTLYSPPEHHKDVSQKTKDDEKEEHFNGIVTETS